MGISRENILKLFRDYTADFDESDGKIKLKIDHTYRVAGICDRIAEDIGLIGEEKDLAWTLGMLHDIGRFKQVREYGTFIDADSIDHALCSVQVLFEDGILRNYLPQGDYDEVIFTAIRHHNVYRLPDGLTERMQMFCDLIRDADKIDIFRVNVETPITTVYGPQAANAIYEAITPEVLSDYMNEVAVLRANKKNSVDHVVAHASLAFELVYPISLQIAREQGYLNQILHYPTENEQAREGFLKMQDKMEEYMQKRGAK